MQLVISSDDERFRFATHTSSFCPVYLFVCVYSLEAPLCTSARDTDKWTY